MEQDRDSSKVDQPTGRAPDEDLAYDPAMTDADEANIPPESDVDPEGGRNPKPGEQRPN